MAIFDFHKKYLQKLLAEEQLRTLTLSKGSIFSSNDYLALSNDPIMLSHAIQALENSIPIGSGGSRLLSGNHPEHIALEEEANRFFGSSSTLFFSTGYSANVATLSTLPQPDDIIIYDALVHASSHAGIRNARCSALSFEHNDPNDAEKTIKQWRAKGHKGTIWLLFETLYSMDGDIALIDDFSAIADRYDAIMVIDEAHATGVYGPDGRGLAAHLDGRENAIILRTCGKALGCEGALLSLPKIARDFLINKARNFIFSTAPSPLAASNIRCALTIVESQPKRREKLHILSQYASEQLAPLGAINTGTQIIPIIIGEASRTMEITHHLQSNGLDVRGVRPPTVAKGTSRLRICISLNINKDDIDTLTDNLRKFL